MMNTTMNCNHFPQTGPNFGSPMGGMAQMGGMPGMGGMGMGMGMDPMAMGMNPMAGLEMLSMTMMSMMTEMMSMLLGQVPMAGGAGQFGGPSGFGGGGSPLNGFLGGGSGSGSGGGGGAAVANNGAGAALGPSDGSTNSSTQNFINKALSHQGAPYVFGAQGPNKFDCSGLVYYALKEAGVTGGRLTARGYQAKYKGSAVRKEDLKPGDLVFFHSKNTRGIPAGQATHIEIYLGNGKTMGTDSPKEGAAVEPINWDTFIGGARVPELNR